MRPSNKRVVGVGYVYYYHVRQELIHDCIVGLHCIVDIHSVFLHCLELVVERACVLFRALFPVTSVPAEHAG